LVAVAVVLGMAAPVDASPEAEQLFRDGRSSMKRGELTQACDAFERSQRLEPKVGTLLNLADCQERLGKTASAWASFLAARALAANQGDRRAAEASRRAAALEARLGYLTTQVPADRRVAELIVKRNGADLDPAVWDAAVPLDPGDYTIEAVAPGFEPWSTTVTVTAGSRARVEIAALVATPGAARVTSGPDDETRATPAGVQETRTVVVIDAPLRTFGLGLFVGATSREDPFVGVRVVGGMPMPRGGLRAVGSAFVRRYEDEPTTPPDPTHTTTTLAIGGAIDYLWLPTPQLALTAGLGVGFEIDWQNQDRGTDVGGFWALRASPATLRLARGRVELGIHLQVARAGDEWTTLMMAGCDVFVR
jgi:hypothetical protein